MASKSSNPEIKRPAVLDRTLKADDIDLINAVREERKAHDVPSPKASRPPKLDRTRIFTERTQAVVSQTWTKPVVNDGTQPMVADDTPTKVTGNDETRQINATQTSLSKTSVSKGSLFNPLETVIRYVHNELLPDKAGSSSSIILSHDG